MPHDHHAPDNGPNIGDLDLAKERRWAEERAACWARFQGAAIYLLTLGERRRDAELQRYEAQLGPWAAGSMRDWLKKVIDERRAKHHPSG